jgi:hypothetical protein
MSSKPNELRKFEGDFSATEFDELRNVRIEGSFSTNPDSINNLIEGNIENSEIVGIYDTRERANLNEIKDSRIHGEIDAKNLLKHGENSIATGGHITSNTALGDAEESLILGDTVQIIEGGIDHRRQENSGNVIAGRDITLGPKKSDKLKWSLQEFHPKNLVNGADRVEKIMSPLIEIPASAAQSLSYALKDEAPEAEKMPVIAEGSHPNENITEYHGEWDELSDYLIDRVPQGDFKGFGVFNLPDEIEGLEELNEVVKDVNQKYPQVKSDIAYIERAISNHDLPALEGSNEEIFKRITEFEDLSRTENIKLKAFDDPEVEGIVYRLGSSQGWSDRFKLEESIEEFLDVIEKSPLSSEGAAQTFGFLDFSEPEDTEELYYELKARDIIGSELGEAYKFAKLNSHVLKLELPWEEDEGIKSQIKNLVGVGDSKDQREIYSKLKEIEDNFEFEKVRESKKLLKSLGTLGSLNENKGLDCQLSGNTNERYQQLLNIEEELLEHMEETWDLGEEAMEVVEEGNTNYLMNNAGNASDYEGGVEEFLLGFRGGNPEKVLEPGFSSTKYLDGEEALDSKEKATDAAYSEGLDLLDRLSREQSKFSIEHPEIEELEEELDRTIEQISNSQGRPPEELIQKKNRLKSEIPEKRREVAFKDLGLEYGEDTDYSDIDPGELRQVLDQLGQEYLEGDETNPETDAGKASDIAGRIDMSDEVGNGYVNFEVYDKDIMNLPSDDRRVPCTFPGGSRDGAFIDYMKDPGTQIALLESGEDNGAVISHPVKQEGQDYLLIHSVESNDGITSRNDVSVAIREQIEEYADETDMEGVIYSTSAHNTAANNFIEAALQQDSEYHEEIYKVDKKGRDDVHLDFNLPEIQGYKVEL